MQHYVCHMCNSTTVQKLQADLITKVPVLILHKNEAREFNVLENIHCILILFLTFFILSHFCIYQFKSIPLQNVSKYYCYPRKNNRKSISSLKASIDSKSSEIYQKSISSSSIIRNSNTKTKKEIYLLTIRTKRKVRKLTLHNRNDIVTHSKYLLMQSISLHKPK